MTAAPLRTYDFDEVRISDGFFHNRMELNRAYLRELDDTCLLQNYYFEAGIIIPGMMTVSEPEQANLHWGWEAPTCQEATKPTHPTTEVHSLWSPRSTQEKALQ